MGDCHCPSDKREILDCFFSSAFRVAGGGSGRLSFTSRLWSKFSILQVYIGELYRYILVN